MTEWVDLKCKGDPPAPRSSHAACALPPPLKKAKPHETSKAQPSLIYIFGGINQDGDTLNDLYVFDTKTLGWSSPAVYGNIPSPRCGHTMTPYGGRWIYLSGGFGHSKAKDLHVLDTGNDHSCRDLLSSLRQSHH